MNCIQASEQGRFELGCHVHNRVGKLQRFHRIENRARERNGWRLCPVYGSNYLNPSNDRGELKGETCQKLPQCVALCLHNSKLHDR